VGLQPHELGSPASIGNPKLSYGIFVSVALAPFIPDDRGIAQLHSRLDDGKA
jgi:hypothetical protein